jgi:trehalose utilization protein
MPQTVTVWNEGIHERENEQTQEIYPEGIGETMAAFFADAGFETRVVTLDDPEHGLTADTLEATDVLVWWGHAAHEAVADEIAERVVEAVREGMGFIALHSSHHAKPFMRLVGTDCDEKFRVADERQRLWVADPGHPIADGIDEAVVVPDSEMYGEPHNIPQPEATVFISWFEGGEVFRSGCCWRRQRGRIFYFSPGHETYPIFHQEEIQRILVNAAEWALPNEGAQNVTYRHAPDPPESLDSA